MRVIVKHILLTRLPTGVKTAVVNQAIGLKTIARSGQQMSQLRNRASIIATIKLCISVFNNPFYACCYYLIINRQVKGRFILLPLDRILQRLLIVIRATTSTLHRNR